MFSMRTITLTLAASAFTLLGACDTTPTNEGKARERRPESRGDSERGLGSADLLVATEKAVDDIANLPDIKKADGKTVIVVDIVRNKTSDPTADFQIYLARIRALLNQSGAKRDLAFVETRTVAEAIKQREGVAAGPQNRTPPRYALAATFYDLPRGKTNFYMLTFQLIDLTNDIVTWEGLPYEVKLRD